MENWIISAWIGKEHWDRVLREKWITLFYMRKCEL